MYREIKKKKLILDNRKPYSREASDFMKEMNTIDWIHSTLLLDGIMTPRANIGRIVKGEFVTDCTISEHLMIRHHCDVIKLAFELSEMRISMDIAHIFKLYAAMINQENPGFRTTNPVLRAWDYIPPHFNEIEEQMDILIKWFNADDLDLNPLQKAVLFHFKFLEIYPFEHYSESMARALLQYELIRNGYPPVQLQLNEQDYNLAVMNYIKREDAGSFYDGLLSCIYNKLEVFMQLTA
jgi:Fic family protein